MFVCVYVCSMNCLSRAHRVVVHVYIWLPFTCTYIHYFLQRIYNSRSLFAIVICLHYLHLHPLSSTTFQDRRSICIHTHAYFIHRTIIIRHRLLSPLSSSLHKCTYIHTYIHTYITRTMRNPSGFTRSLHLPGSPNYMHTYTLIHTHV